MEQPTTEQIDATKGDTLNVLREQLVDKETIKTSGKNHILVARSPNGIWFVAPKLWVHGDLTTETLGGLADYWRMMREGNTFATREEAINAGLNQMEAVLKLRHRRQSPADEKNRTKILDAIEKTAHATARTFAAPRGKADTSETNPYRPHGRTGGRGTYPHERQANHRRSTRNGKASWGKNHRHRHPQHGHG